MPHKLARSFKAPHATAKSKSTFLLIFIHIIKIYYSCIITLFLIDRKYDGELTHESLLVYTIEELRG